MYFLWGEGRLVYVLLWTPTYGWAKAGRPARTYIQQLCEDTRCSPEDLLEAVNDREKWRERVRDICAVARHDDDIYIYLGGGLLRMYFLWGWGLTMYVFFEGRSYIVCIFCWGESYVLCYGGSILPVWIFLVGGGVLPWTWIKDLNTL